MSGATFSQALGAGLLGGAIGAAMGAATVGIGGIALPCSGTSQMTTGTYNFLNLLVRSTSHGVLNGGMRLVQGGRFEHGLMSGFFSSMGMGGAGRINNPGPVGYMLIGAAIGSTAETLGGGKFANGAVTGAFIGLLHHAMHGDGLADDEPTESEGGYLSSKKEAFRFARNKANMTQKEVSVYTEINSKTGEESYFVQPWKDNKVDQSINIYEPREDGVYNVGTGYKIIRQDHFAPIQRNVVVTYGGTRDWLTSIKMGIPIYHHDNRTGLVNEFYGVNYLGTIYQIK